MKKQFTVYGNCQSTILAACLQQVKSFSDNYKYIRLPFCHRISSDEYKKAASMMADLNLFIYQPVSSAFRGGGFDSQTLSDLAPNSLGIPSLQFYGYFPSLTRFRLPSKLSVEKNNLINNILMPFPTLNRDSLYHYNEIRMMVLENLPTSVICDRFDYGSSQEFQLERCLGWTIKHLVSKETEFDLIPISDFFENNWQNKLLFYTPRHPTGFVMAELVRRICNKLNLPIYDDELQKIIKKDHFSHIKLYIPFWIRKNYLSNIPELNDETFYSLSAVDTVSLYTNLYRLLPEVCHE